MTEQTCQCGRPTAGAWLCPRCIETLEISIVNVSAHHGDLNTLRRKQTRYTDGHGKGGIGKSQPLPVDLRFTDRTGDGSRLDDETRNTVSTWCRTVMEEQPRKFGPYCATACVHASCAELWRKRYPRDTVSDMCSYLMRQLRFITQERWADEILDEFTDLETRLARMVDRPADRWYAGKCSAQHDAGNGKTVICEAELYAKADKGHVDCRVCGERHDIKTRRELLLNEAREVLVTATEAAGALLAWTDYDGSMQKLIDRITKWRERGLLSSRGHAMVKGQDRDLYRLGDIETRLMSVEQERRLRRSA